MTDTSKQDTEKPIRKMGHTMMDQKTIAGAGVGTVSSSIVFAIIVALGGGQTEDQIRAEEQRFAKIAESISAIDQSIKQEINTLNTSVGNMEMLTKTQITTLERRLDSMEERNDAVLHQINATVEKSINDLRLEIIDRTSNRYREEDDTIRMNRWIEKTREANRGYVDIVIPTFP